MESVNNNNGQQQVAPAQTPLWKQGKEQGRPVRVHVELEVKPSCAKRLKF